MLRWVGRLLLVAFGCVAAASATLFVLVTLGLERLTRAAHGKTSEDAIDGAVVLVWKAGRLLDLLAAVPGMVVVAGFALVAVGEIARIRSPLFYVAGGGAILAGAALALHGTEPAPLASAGWQVPATAGFAGGLVYWLVAGRSA